MHNTILLLNLHALEIACWIKMLLGRGECSELPGEIVQIIAFSENSF